jgi:hypothetical protein
VEVSGGGAYVAFVDSSGKRLGRPNIIGGDMEYVGVPSGFVAFVFDLDRSLDKQWQEQGKVFSEMLKYQGRAPKSPRPTRHDYLRYLRVLDARENGATWRTIAESGVLGRHMRSNASKDDGPQAARQVWEQARHLMFNWPN